MIHRTFRSLDDAPKLVGFTIRGWAALIAGSCLLFAIVHMTHMAGKPAITLGVFAIGLPAALSYVSESGGLALGVLGRDICRWRLGAKMLPAASLTDRAPRGVLIAQSREPTREVADSQSQCSTSDAAFWGRWE